MTTNNINYAELNNAKVVGDEGLKAYTRKVFNYMMLSLGLTALVTYFMLRTGFIRHFFRITDTGVGYSLLGFLVVISPLFISMYMSFSRTITSKGSKIGLFSIAALEGASVSLLVSFAGVSNAFQAFLITGILFGSMSLYGFLTNKDLLKLGNILMMGVWGLVLVSIFSLFFGGVGIWFSYLTVIIFTGLVAYETQQIKNIYYQIGNRGELADKYAVFCALSLYLSFLNIFMAILRITSKDR